MGRGKKWREGTHTQNGRLVLHTSERAMCLQRQVEHVSQTSKIKRQRQIKQCYFISPLTMLTRRVKVNLDIIWECSETGHNELHFREYRLHVPPNR